MAELLRRLLNSPQGAIGLTILAVTVAAVLIGPWAAPQNPEGLFPLARYKPPSAANWLGTDQYGRDILSRLLYGARATVSTAVMATALGTLAGAVIGTLSAFVGGRVDEAIMRTVDAVLSVPSLLFALLIVNLLGKSSLNALVAVGIAFAPGMARITRSAALTVRKQDYVNAAIARGESTRFIVLREMLPNVIAPIIVEMTIRISFAVMLFATLSFLGLGAQPPASEWGLMVSEARRYVHLSPWMIVWPSVAIAVVAIGFNLLGDGLRDVLNPRT
jgi:peptide/nickel transport system permease protein